MPPVPVASRMDDNDTGGQNGEPGREAHLRRIAPAVVSLDVYCRIHGLDDLAARVGELVAQIDEELTGQK